jgi:hypothetical protein
MMNNSKKIDQYIWNLLPDNERVAFEQELATDAALREELAVRQVEDAALRLMRRDDLTNKMATWRKEDAEETTPEVVEKKTETKSFVIPEYRGAKRETPKITLFPNLSVLKGLKMTANQFAVAATLALLVVAGGVYFASANFSNEGLLTDAYKDSKETLAKPTPSAQGGQEDVFGGSGETVLSAEELFNTKKSSLTKADYQKAMAGYQKTVDNPNNLLTDIRKAEWQIVLCYLAMNETGEPFRKLVEQIADTPAHPFNEPAKDLRYKTQSFWWRLTH